MSVALDRADSSAPAAIRLLPDPGTGATSEPDLLRYLSASRLKCWQTCRRQFYFRYVERIAVLNSRIVRYAVEGDNDVLVVRLQTRICDYTLSDVTGQLISGSKTRELFMTYDWKLIRQKDQKTQQTATMTAVSCPNCGAPLSVNQSGQCEYCGSVITLNDHDWALSQIKGISQRSAN